ncbi:hypothetical protein BV20DRAFT_1069660 [Pilatotrama ljubarskyi]|nr:hypothetical protein BV20DRAFT_1069660 [Pilatotrama ljubarskyi]
MSSDGPPWYARQPDTGKISFLDIPERLQTHPDLQRRGIIPTDPNKIGFVYTARSSDKPQYTIKILNLDTEELAIYERLLRLDPASPNHTLPCEISQSGHPLLIMPYLTGWTIFQKPSERNVYNVLGLFLQVLEGVEFLHSNRIAHLDLCPGNVLVAHPQDLRHHPHIVAGKVYIIDFDTSKQLPLGPGEQHAITLPSTQIDPPAGLEHFDPYSWDVYCAGHVLEYIIKANLEEDPAWIARRFARWLIGNERRCIGVCHCRPTARRARQVLTVLRVLAYASRLAVQVASVVQGGLSRYMGLS